MSLFYRFCGNLKVFLNTVYALYAVCVTCLVNMFSARTISFCSKQVYNGKYFPCKFFKLRIIAFCFV